MELQKTEETVTTKELAERLNTSSKVILENARKCLPNKNIENGKPTFWNKAEVTILIDCLKNNSSNHASDLYFQSKGTISTDLTPALKIKKAMELMQEGYEEELAILRAKNAELQPKGVAYDEFVSREKFCNFRDASNYLHIGQTDFMNILKSRYIYKNSVGEYRCYSGYSQYFTLRPFALGDKTRQQLMLTLKGLDYFKNKINSKTEAGK